MNMGSRYGEGDSSMVRLNLPPFILGIEATLRDLPEVTYKVLKNDPQVTQALEEITSFQTDPDLHKSF